MAAAKSPMHGAIKAITIAKRCIYWPKRLKKCLSILENKSQINILITKQKLDF